jgi:hypothetical protein
MTKTYTTETGYYVLCDSEGRVLAKAAVPTGKHPVDDRADPSESYDVDSNTDLETVEIDPHYATE